MRESYKRFVKTWICFANPWICFVSWPRILTPKRFVLYCDWRIWLHRFEYPDSQVRSLKIQIVDSISDLNFQRFDLFSRIQQILTNPDKFSTIAQNKSLQIQAGRLANPDSRIQTLKVCFADSICRAFFKRFILWIWLVRPKISNYSICYQWSGFLNMYLFVQIFYLDSKSLTVNLYWD